MYVLHKLFSQVERATVESYSGDTVPPYIEVTVTPAGDNVNTFPNLAKLVKFTGMDQPRDIVLKKGVVCGINYCIQISPAFLEDSMYSFCPLS